MQQETDFSQLDNIASPVFVIDVSRAHNPVYVAYNCFARTLSGRPLSDYIGKTALEIYPSAEGRTIFDRHCDAAKSGEMIDYEQDMLVGGLLRNFQSRLMPIKDSTGRITQLYGSSRDTTEELRAREAQVSLGTLAAEMEQFVSIAARDLRTPMRNVALLADMLRENFIDHGDGKVHLIDTLEEVAVKSMSLISDVLAHARAAVPQGNVEQFSFPALCRDICDVLDPQVRHVVTYGAAKLAADRTALQIVLRSILDNAMEQGGEDSLKIDILVKALSTGMLEFTLSSTGPALTGPTLSFLDGCDQQADNGFTLFGVRRLVNARGGLIEIEASESAGGTICFTLPGLIISGTAALSELPAATGPAELHHDAMSGTQR